MSEVNTKTTASKAGHYCCMMNQSKSSCASRKTTYNKRKRTLKRKAEELCVLCGVPVGLVCIEPDGNIETWPPEKHKVHQILKAYMIKSNVSSSVSSEFKNKNPDEKKKRAIKKEYETWDSRLDYLPEESLVEILKSLEGKEKIMEERLGKLISSSGSDNYTENTVSSRSTTDDFYINGIISKSKQSNFNKIVDFVVIDALPISVLPAPLPAPPADI